MYWGSEAGFIMWVQKRSESSECAVVPSVAVWSVAKRPLPQATFNGKSASKYKQDNGAQHGVINRKHPFKSHVVPRNLKR